MKKIAPKIIKHATEDLYETTFTLLGELEGRYKQIWQKNKMLLW